MRSKYRMYWNRKASLSVSFIKVREKMYEINQFYRIVMNGMLQKVGSNSSTKVNLKLFKPFIVNHDLLLYVCPVVLPWYTRKRYTTKNWNWASSITRFVYLLYKYSTNICLYLCLCFTHQNALKVLVRVTLVVYFTFQAKVQSIELNMMDVNKRRWMRKYYL